MVVIKETEIKSTTSYLFLSVSYLKTRTNTTVPRAAVGSLLDGRGTTQTVRILRRIHSKILTPE